MTGIRSRLALALSAVVGAAVLALPGAASAASVWAPVASPTTDTITGLARVSATRMWIVTAGGAAFVRGDDLQWRAGTGLANAAFTDLAVSPDGATGVAVGPAGQIWRSANGGASWTRIAAPQTRTSSCGTSTPTSGPLATDLSSVSFADAATVYATAAGGSIVKSTNGGATFAEVNKRADGTCAVPASTSPFKQGPTDTKWVDAKTGYVLTSDFGQVYATGDGLATAEARQSTVNGYEGRASLGFDPAAPDRLFAVNDFGTGTSYCATSGDGARTNGPSCTVASRTNGAPARTNTDTLRAVDLVGTTGVTVGDLNDVFTSTDGGATLVDRPAPVAADTSWRSVDVTSPADATIAGSGGQIAETGAANRPFDDTPPTATIQGPTKVTEGRTAAYTVALADGAGSGVDPASVAWIADGQRGVRAPTARFRFDSAGPKQVAVFFRDLEGNRGSATLAVTVVAVRRAPPTSTATAGPVTALIPRTVAAATAKRPARIRLVLRVKTPGSRVRITVRQRGRVRARASVTLKTRRRTVTITAKGLRRGTAAVRLQVGRRTVTRGVKVR